MADRCPCCEGSRPEPGSAASRLEPGQREYRGYEEWAVHPDEACFVLHRGYALVDGQPAEVMFIHNEAFVTQLRVYGSDVAYSLEANYWASPTREADGRDLSCDKRVGIRLGAGRGGRAAG